MVIATASMSLSLTIASLFCWRSIQSFFIVGISNFSASNKSYQ